MRAVSLHDPLGSVLDVGEKPTFEAEVLTPEVEHPFDRPVGRRRRVGGNLVQSPAEGFGLAALSDVGVDGVLLGSVPGRPLDRDIAQPEGAPPVSSPFSTGRYYVS